MPSSFSPRKDRDKTHYGKTEGPFHSKYKQRNAETEVGVQVSLSSDGDKIPWGSKQPAVSSGPGPMQKPGHNRYSGC